MARIFYSQKLTNDIQDKRLFATLSALDDNHAVFVTPRGQDAEDFIVLRSDGVHYVRQLKASSPVKTGPRFGPWTMEDGSTIPNPYSGISQAGNSLTGALRENAIQILDASEEDSPKVREFRDDIKVFPVLIFFTPKVNKSGVDKPSWGTCFQTVGAMEKYFSHPMKWQHNRPAITLKLSRIETERIARLLGYVQRQVDSEIATAAHLRRIPDPYEFAREVGGNRFFGRADELIELQDFIRSGKHAAVFGLQRVGKTSLIKESFSRAYPEISQRPVFIEVNLHRLSVRPEEPGEFLSDFIEAVVFAASNLVETAAIPLGALQKETTQYLSANHRPQQLAIALHKFLDALRRDIARPICIFVDELQVLGEASKDADSTRLYQSFIRALGDTAKNSPIQFLFSGRLSVLKFNEVFDWQLLKLCKKLEIGFLDSSAAKELISKPSEKYLSWDATAVEELISLSGGHPYFLQYMCSALVSYANNKNANRILREDVNAVALEIVQSKVEQSTIRLLYSDFESSGTLVHELLERISKSRDTRTSEKEIIPPGIRGKDREKMAVQLLQELVRADLLEVVVEGDSRLYSLKVGLIRLYFERMGVLPVGPEALGSANSIIDRIETILCSIVVDTLKQEFGAEETGWWRQGIPAKIRTRIVTQREEDPERLNYGAYFYTIEYKEILEANWKVFKVRFCVDAQKKAADNLDWIRKINTIRKSAMHATRSKARGGVKPEEMDFLRERLSWLEAKQSVRQPSA